MKNALTRLAAHDKLDDAAARTIEETADSIQGMIDGLGFCLSEAGDLLSQWRGYANDATGISIGFSRAYLENLANSTKTDRHASFRLQKVLYRPEEHEALVHETYSRIRELIREGALKPMGRGGLLTEDRTDEQIAKDTEEAKTKFERFYYTLFGLYNKLYALKTDAFLEEQEWRLISFLIGGNTQECLFRERQGKIIPYRKFDLNIDEATPIAEVILGPKHQTPPVVIARMLKHCGFGEVAVRRSMATYR